MKASILSAWAVLGFLIWFFGSNILFFGAGCVLGIASMYKGLGWVLGKTKPGRMEKYYDWLIKGGGQS